MRPERGAHPRGETAARTAVRGALELTAGAALVLDDELRVVEVTPSAEALLGLPIPLGARAPDVICGADPDRPFALALAAGQPAEGLVAAPGDPARHVRLRAMSLGPKQGWLLVGRADSTPFGAADEPVLFHGMWTRDVRMKQLFRLIEKVGPQDFTVLVRGETGAGKELVASALHAVSSRRAGPFRAINCAALPANLLESELFGHVRGAYTGATQDVPGHVQLAHRGTLFLDEVAELPLELQAKLLRVIETGQVLPVGAREAVPVDVRFVSATHRSLRQAVEAGRFRADLMFRLRVIPLFLPPLRERPNDVALLVEKLLADLHRRGLRRIARVSEGALRALEAYPWPGNIRELRNVLTYAYAVGDGDVLDLADLPTEVSGTEGAALGDVLVSPAVSSPAPVVDDESKRISDALRRASGSRDRAAKLLGMSRVTLWRRMRELGLERREGEPRDPKSKG
ncbi:MAG: sigma 54-interacting transcriptional regulator [Polyangiaceae bacterium]